MEINTQWRWRRKNADREADRGREAWRSDRGRERAKDGHRLTVEGRGGDKKGRMSGIHIGEKGEKGEQQKQRRRGTDEMKGEKESLNKLLLRSEGQWSIVRVWKSGSTHTLHTHICTRTHTGLLWLFRPVQRKETMGLYPLVGPQRAQSVFVHISDKVESWSKCLALGFLFWMALQHWRQYNGIRLGQHYNSIRNTNDISWLNLSWAQLRSLSPTNYDAHNPFSLGLWPTAQPPDCAQWFATSGSIKPGTPSHLLIINWAQHEIILRAGNSGTGAQVHTKHREA